MNLPHHSMSRLYNLMEFVGSLLKKSPTAQFYNNEITYSDMLEKNRSI